jgi:thioredoxin-like negative regulator of GroEL
MDLLTRLLIALGLLLVILAGIRLARIILSARTRRTVQALNQEARSSDAPARILYFTSDRCVQCELRQTPALDALVGMAPEELRVETFDAARDREIAGRYRILTAPSTVVVRTGGQIAAINHGFASADQIAAQLGWRPVATA